MENTKRTWQPISPVKATKPFFTYDYDSSEWKVGDWILIRHVKENDKALSYSVSDPIFALFVGFSLWDMALVVNYVESRVGDGSDPEISQIALWRDNMLVLDRWSSKPSISQIKNSLKKM